MKKNLFIITFFLGAFSLSAQTQKQEKTITVEVQNNWNQPKADAPVVINLHELHAGFKVKSAVVMAVDCVSTRRIYKLKTATLK